MTTTATYQTTFGEDDFPESANQAASGHDASTVPLDSPRTPFSNIWDTFRSTRSATTVTTIAPVTTVTFNVFDTRPVVTYLGTDEDRGVVARLNTETGMMEPTDHGIAIDPTAAPYLDVDSEILPRILADGEMLESVPLPDSLEEIGPASIITPTEVEPTEAQPGPTSTDGEDVTPLPAEPVAEEETAKPARKPAAAKKATPAKKPAAPKAAAKRAPRRPA